LSNDKKQTTYKVPILNKIPIIGKILFTSKGVIERKTDLVIQITPKIIVDAYSGIVKSEEVSIYEDYVIKRHLSKQDENQEKQADESKEIPSILDSSEEKGE